MQCGYRAVWAAGVVRPEPERVVGHYRDRGISEVIDSHDVLIVHADQRGLFEGNRQEARLVIHALA